MDSPLTILKVEETTGYIGLCVDASSNWPGCRYYSTPAVATEFSRKCFFQQLLLQLHSRRPAV